MMAVKRDKPPMPTVVKRGGRLVPETGYDAETLDRLPEGTVLDTRERSPRSLPHLKKYWSLLWRVVDATDDWATAEKLHESLKLSLGYITQIWDPDRMQWLPSVDSVALANMTQAEFNIFYERAMERLVKWTGIDLEAAA